MATIDDSKACSVAQMRQMAEDAKALGIDPEFIRRYQEGLKQKDKSNE